MLKEYAALPDKFRFVEVCGLREAIAGLRGQRLTLTFYFSGVFSRLENAIKADALALFCVPAVNLFEQQIDRIDVAAGRTEYHLVARMQPRDKEIIQILDLRGGGSGSERTFLPIYEAIAAGRAVSSKPSYYTTRRERRMRTRLETSSTSGVSSYAGTEMFVALAEIGAAPYGSDLRYLSARALCSNRDLPLYLAKQAADATYEFERTLPVQSIECVAGPSDPLAPAVDGFEPWEALSHLFVNYLSLFDTSASRGGEALKAMLSLYATKAGHPLQQQADGLTAVSARQITRRIPGGGPLAFGRGVEVRLSMTDRAFNGGSPFQLAAVLEYYLAAHVSINSFVEVTLELVDRAEQLKWPTRFGRRPSF